MSKSYVIQWKSSVNGRAGKGSKVFDFEAATRLAEELNREYPAIHHEVAEANSSSEHTPGPRSTNATESSEPVAELPQTAQRPDFAFSE